MLFYRASISWVVASALFIQALIPFGQALLSPVSSEPLVICTQYGLRVLRPFQNPTNEERESADRSECAICISIDGARIFSPNLRLGDPAYSLCQVIAYFGEGDFMDSKPREHRGWPRAPPHLA